MEFIYNSSNPKADTRWGLEGVAASEEECCQQLVLLLMQPKDLSCRMRCTQVEGLVVELHNCGQVGCSHLSDSQLSHLCRTFNHAETNPWSLSMQPVLQNDMPDPCLYVAYQPQQKYTVVFQN